MKELNGDPSHPLLAAGRATRIVITVAAERGHPATFYTPLNRL